MPNIHEEYYDEHKEHLDDRFSDRKKNDTWLYIKQNIIIFGSAIIFLITLLKSKINYARTYTEVAGWDITFTCCTMNLIFAYAFGFVAVVNDWWFFFPDLFSGIFWNIGNGHMVLGDVIFYILATIMGHLAIIFTMRLHKEHQSTRRDNFLKFLWFVPALIIALFSITFGSDVSKGMVLWLYFPFGLFGVLLYNRFNAFDIWFPTAVFVICEFIWDAIARVMGVWIFPDATTNPGLYVSEITFFHLGKYPVIWQPEMTQMSYISGLICLVFFLAARTFIRGEPLTHNPIHQ